MATAKVRIAHSRLKSPIKGEERQSTEIVVKVTDAEENQIIVGLQTHEESRYGLVKKKKVEALSLAAEKAALFSSFAVEDGRRWS